MLHTKQNKILIIDIGNSYCKLAVACKNQILKKIIIKNDTTLNSEKAQQQLQKFQKIKLCGSIIGSVDPSLTKLFYEAILTTLKIKADLIKPQTKLNFNLPNSSKSKVGQDILALAQYCCDQNQNAIAFCFGTAIFAIIIKNKNLIGASISIGLTKNLEALNSNTKLINKIKINKLQKLSWGIDTKTALASGIYHYAIGFMNNFYKEAKQYLKTNNLVCMISGGEILNKIKTDFKYELNNNAILLGYNSIYWTNHQDNLK